MSADQKNWDFILTAQKPRFRAYLKELWNYRYLIRLLIRRDIIAFYQQTIFGPLWYILSPLLTTLVFVVIFGKIARIPTDQTPPILFYLSGAIMWNYFASSFQQTSQTFLKNCNLFDAVYFPRLTVPVSNVCTNLLQFCVQFLLFLGFYLYFLSRGMPLAANFSVVFLPLLILQMAALGIGAGCFMSALTRKYRDLSFLAQFGIQLWMFLTPVVYPASLVPKEYLWLYMLNPMASIMEMFRFMFFGQGMVSATSFIVSWLITLFLLFIGVMSFHRVENRIMDTL